MDNITEDIKTHFPNQVMFKTVKKYIRYLGQYKVYYISEKI